MTYYRVTTPDEGSDGKTRFREVGVAFEQKESAKSHMTIKLFAVPLTGELVLFPPNDSNKDGN